MRSTSQAASWTGPLANPTTQTIGDAPEVQIARSLSQVPRTNTGAPPEEPTIADSRTRLLHEDVAANVVAIVEPVVATQSTPVFQTRQAWEGVVSAVRGDEFVALLNDRTDSARPDEEMIFDINEVAPVERQLVTPGAVFYLFIGIERTPGGQQKNVTTIRFRRLPVWTRSAIDRTEARAREIRDVLGTK